MQPRVLIVDDQHSIREPLSIYLRRFDFDVETVADGVAMRRCLKERDFELIVLDVMLPGENGLSLCRYVVEQEGIPVILLTAVTEQADKIAGLEVGADDYVMKPFDPRELVARIRSVLRRAQQRNVVPDRSASDRTVLCFNKWSLDTKARELLNPEKAVVPMSTSEFHLLRALCENANRVLSRTQLLDLTKRADSAVFDRSIDSQISRLRKKLEVDPRRPSLLKTVRGDGYLFATQVTNILA